MNPGLGRQTAIVTGAASSIFAAPVRMHSDEGLAGLVLTDRVVVDLARIVAEPCATSPVETIGADLSESAGQIATASAAFERIDRQAIAAIFTTRKFIETAYFAIWNAFRIPARVMWGEPTDA